MQLQKINNNSKPGELHPQTKTYIECLKKSVRFRSRNPPITKAYYSISKYLPTKVYKYTPSELANYIQEEITNIEDHVKQLWEN